MAISSLKDSQINAFSKSRKMKIGGSLDVEYLVIGGGGGSGYAGAGGGAGGFRSSVAGEMSGGGLPAERPLSVNTGVNYTVTIGAGGVGGTQNDKGATNGSVSVFASIYAAGGGLAGGGGRPSSSGGCGGGAGQNSYTPGGVPIPGQGFRGGNAQQLGGGGGGAGSQGGDGGGNNSGLVGNGGVGVSSSITGTPY